MSEDYINEIKALVRECGEYILKADRSTMDVESKWGSANFVTTYDKAVQEKLREGLARILPQARFVGEEGEGSPFSDEGLCFIVDPIDGTTNFIKDYHASCISVGLIENGRARAGVIYNPYLDEMFYAERGKGAYCNESKITVSGNSLENGIVLFGSSPYNEELNEQSFTMAYDYFRRALDIRRSGSAALDLCSIAAGRAELYFELRLSPWDYAAGALIVEEAGGVVKTIDGKEISFDKPCSILAKNGV